MTRKKANGGLTAEGKKDFAGYNAQRTPLDAPVDRSVVRAVQSTVVQPLVLLPTSGGSLPRYVFKQELGVATLTVPVAN